jgi:hypothetical protein
MKIIINRFIQCFANLETYTIKTTKRKYTKKLNTIYKFDYKIFQLAHCKHAARRDVQSLPISNILRKCGQQIFFFHSKNAAAFGMDCK